MSTRPLPPISSIVDPLPATVPFVGPEQQERERGRPFAARLGANESVFGPSPRAVEAMAKAAADAWQYCDALSHDLREALAAHHGVGYENILVGEGIDGILGNTVRLFTDPGDVVVTSAGAYPTFNYHVNGFGARLETVPYRDDFEDPEALIGAAREAGARLLYISNPDNPMGSHHPAERIQAMIDALPEGCVLCLDEAYIEYAPEGTAPALDTTDPRVLRFRTFSKAYGLAGARIGYAIGEARVIALFDRIRNHFGVNRIAQAGALAALEDQDYLADVLEAAATSREEVARIALAEGLTPLPSATNFVAVDCGHDGDYARAVLKALIERDVFVRMPGVAPLDRTVRIGTGRPDDMAVLAERLGPALSAAQEAVGI